MNRTRTLVACLALIGLHMFPATVLSETVDRDRHVSGLELDGDLKGYVEEKIRMGEKIILTICKEYYPHEFEYKNEPCNNIECMCQQHIRITKEGVYEDLDISRKINFISIYDLCMGTVGYGDNDMFSVPRAYCKIFSKDRHEELDALSHYNLSIFIILAKIGGMLSEKMGVDAKEAVTFYFGFDRELFPLHVLDEKAATRDFEIDRMKKRFPIGTPLADMIYILARSGFRCDFHGSDGKCDANPLVFRTKGKQLIGLGSVPLGLIWRSDAAGRLDCLEIQYLMTQVPEKACTP